LTGPNDPSREERFFIGDPIAPAQNEWFPPRAVSDPGFGAVPTEKQKEIAGKILELFNEALFESQCLNLQNVRNKIFRVKGLCEEATSIGPKNNEFVFQTKCWLCRDLALSKFLSPTRFAQRPELRRLDIAAEAAPTRI
jgi:hypothetical protein